MSDITTIGVGSAANDGTGDPARTAFQACNTNFSNLNTDKLEPNTAFTGDLVFNEAADHASTPAAGKGYLWVKNDAPSSLIFTDDAGTDYDLTDITSTPEGTAILSTGEVGGTKFLREDGDGTSSWQVVPAPEGTSVLSTGPVTDGYVLTADGAGGAAWEAAAGGVDWSTTQTTTGNFTFKLSDAAGASKLSLTDSADAEVLAIDSYGRILNGIYYLQIDSSDLDFKSTTGQFYATLGASIGWKIRPGSYYGWGSAVTGSGGVLDTTIYRDAAGVVRVDDALRISDTGYTVATLPTGTTGTIARVTDASSPTIGNAVSGGGAAFALVCYNGSAWNVIGV